MPRSRSSTSALTMLTSSSSAFSKQAGGEGGRDQLGVLAGHFAAIVQRAALRARPCPTAPAAGPADRRRPDSRAALSSVLAIERRHVHGVADGAGRQEIDQQSDALRRPPAFGPLRCSRPGAACTARPACRTAGCRCTARSANTSSATPPMLAALEPFDQRRFVVDAAAGAVDQPHARLHDVRVSLRADQVAAFRRSAACGRSDNRPAAACRATLATRLDAQLLRPLLGRETDRSRARASRRPWPAWRRPGRCGPGRRCPASCRPVACPCTCCGPTCPRSGSDRPGRCCATGPASWRSCARPC